MKLTHYENVTLEDITMDGAKGAKIRWLISQKDGAPNFSTRLFEVDPEGFTPYHSHSWEHENFIIEGIGVLVTEDGDKPFKKGDVIYVPPFMKHSYKNTGNGTLKFLCMIPNEKKDVKKTVNPFATGVANNC
ncbi:MAG: cupin domain-containing protein [Candidatus Cloacimonetes bacterium]|nr:cupin domain-containing protein [Candidatus Cloacimonadota bacterium]